MNNTREIIFEMEDPDYRVVCQFNYDNFLPYVWWGYLQKKLKYKKWLFFGEQRHKWIEVGKCWWNFDFEKREELEEAAKKLYKDKVVIPQKSIEQAMNL